MTCSHSSHGLLANISEQDPQFSGTRWELLLYSDRSQSGCHVPHTSLMLLLACYVVLVMTETNTVWYGKAQQGSYLCKQNRNRWDLRIWGEKSWYSMLVRLWIFTNSLALQKRSRIFKSSDCAIEKYHRERQRQCSRGPASVWQAAPQRECQPTPEAMQLQQDIQDLSTHSLLLFMRNWHSAAPDAHISPAWYLQESLELLLPERNKASFCSMD